MNNSTARYFHNCRRYIYMLFVIIIIIYMYMYMYVVFYELLMFTYIRACILVINYYIPLP
jgi:hypothetical protein